MPNFRLNRAFAALAEPLLLLSHLASHVRNALVWGIFPLAVILLLAAGDADSQTVPADEFRNSDVVVSRTSFREDAGRLDPANEFFIMALGWTSGTPYVIHASLHDGTGPNGAKKGEDFTELENLRPGDPEWIQSSGRTTMITFSIIDDEIYEGSEPKTFILRVRGGTIEQQLAMDA